MALAAAMPGLHTFTGCDFTAAFYRKDKTKPLEMLEKYTEGTRVQFFSSMTSEEEPNHKKAEEFVCSLYGMKGDIKNVNEVIVYYIYIFRQNPRPMNFECALLPPYAKIPRKKTQRAHFISIVCEY